jgi:hypothetical protein
VDPELTVSIETDGAVGHGELTEDALVFVYRRRPVARVEGPREKLLLLSELLDGRQKLMPGDLLGEELPREIASFLSEVEAATAEANARIADGRTLVEAAERLVCALYAVPADLEEEVVEHAITRADAASARSA